MKEFSSVRDLIGQIGSDLEAKAGKIGASFRASIRKELEQIGGEKGIAHVSITQASGSSLVTLHIEDWADEQERRRIERQFKTLMDRLGASMSGTCSGAITGNLLSFLRRN